MAENDRQLDQFYSSPNAVKQTLKVLQQNFNLDKAIFIEPSAGSGNFISGIKENFPNNKWLAFDLEPKQEYIIKQDFFKLNLAYNKNNITIGNPPFGYKSKLAIDFINKSFDFSDVVCFILPIQFRRYGVQKQIRKDVKLIYSSENLPDKSFIYLNKAYNVNCLIQIWIKDNKKIKNKRDLRIKTSPPNNHKDFKLFIYNNTEIARKYFDKKTYQWDFAIHRQGYYDYSIKITNPKNLKTNRQYLFVKYIDPKSKEIFEKIDFIKLSNTNTSVKGFSNTDLVKEYVRIKDSKLDKFKHFKQYLLNRF